MRRFLIDGTVFEQPLTGVARATLGLYQGLLDINADFKVTICHRQPLHGEIPANIKTVQIPAETDGLWRTHALPQYVRDSDHDIIHFPWNGGIPASLPEGILKILTLHDVLPLMIPGYFRNPLRKMNYRANVKNSLRLTDLVITDSNYSRQQILQKFHPRIDPLVIYPASPLLPEDTAVAAPRNETFFFYCGGYDKRKGIELLLETFIELWRNKELQIPLWLVGASKEYSTRLSNLLNEARELGAIKELGYISDEELIRCYQNAIALIYPSRYEGFGLPPLEAMKLGCPVVTYRLTSLPEVCGEAVLYIEPDQGNTLKNLILKIADDEKLRKRLSELGIQQASRFSWSQSAQVFLQAIEKRLAG